LVGQRWNFQQAFLLGIRFPAVGIVPRNSIVIHHSFIHSLIYHRRYSTLAIDSVFRKRIYGYLNICSQAHNVKCDLRKGVSGTDTAALTKRHWHSGTDTVALTQSVDTLKFQSFLEYKIEMAVILMRRITKNSQLCLRYIFCLLVSILWKKQQQNTDCTTQKMKVNISGAYLITLNCTAVQSYMK
jgi:hypothetical protein